VKGNTRGGKLKVEKNVNFTFRLMSQRQDKGEARVKSKIFREEAK
jgi:hypothetical protein